MLRLPVNPANHRIGALSQTLTVFKDNLAVKKTYARRISANDASKSGGKKSPVVRGPFAHFVDDISVNTLCPADNDDINDLFKQELDKRQIRSIDDLSNEDSLTNFAGGPPPAEKVAVSRDRQRQKNANPPPPFANADDQVPPQLQKSRELNSEGLEGLIPRATELLKLGTSVFLAFGPFILAVTIAFAAIYFVST